MSCPESADVRHTAECDECQHDEVSNPEHYQYGGFQVWDILESVANKMREFGRKGGEIYHTVSAMKYLMRWWMKGGYKDVGKAMQHLTRMTVKYGD